MDAQVSVPAEDNPRWCKCSLEFGICDRCFAEFEARLAERDAMTREDDEESR